MKNIAFLLMILMIVIIIIGCGQASITKQNNANNFSAEQIEALGRLDPLHFLTDNKTIFTLKQDEVLNNLEDKIDLPDWAEQIPNGYIRSLYNSIA